MDSRFANMLRPFLRYAGAVEITPDSSLRDLGLDSMQAIELLFAIEDTYRVSLPDELLTDTTFATAGNLWTAIRSVAATTEAESC